GRGEPRGHVGGVGPLHRALGERRLAGEADVGERAGPALGRRGAEIVGALVIGAVDVAVAVVVLAVVAHLGRRRDRAAAATVATLAGALTSGATLASPAGPRVAAA